MEESFRVIRKRKRKPQQTDSAKKRKRSAIEKKYRAGRIGIGSQIERWKKFQADNDLRHHADVARVLLDNYYNTFRREAESVAGPSGFKKPEMLTSTPAKDLPVQHQSGTPSVSEISSQSSHLDSEETLSATEGPEMEHVTATSTAASTATSTAASTATSTAASTATSTSTSTTTTKAGRTVQRQMYSSFVDPFNLSIDVSEIIEDDEADGSDDPDYEPSFEMMATLPGDVNDMCEEVVFEEVAFGMEADDGIDIEGVEEELGPGVKRVKTPDAVQPLVQDSVCFAYVDQLKALAATNVNRCTQSECQYPTEIQMTNEFIGSAFYLKWFCRSGHLVHRWCAQPLLNRRVHSADFLSSLAILTSGNNVGKMILWAKHMNLKFMSSTTFHRIQKCYLVPTIDEYWADMQEETVQSFQDKDLIVLGDGRNDSPGHCAQYCSYTLMEESTKKILTIQTLDKRMTDRKSQNMEKAGFKSAMGELQGKGINITEVATDAHLGIGVVMRNEYPGIKHSHDIWHAAKNLGKKITKVAQKKENKALIPWQRDIINHFWFSCSQANTYEEFKCIWRSLLHHITNQHKWSLSHGEGINACLHGPLDEEEREKEWLSPSRHSKTLLELAGVMMSKRLLNNVHFYLNFRSTSELEVFHQLILMYCAKRFAYTPPVYRARNRLAAIDHNHHTDRSLRRNKKGEIMYHRYYNKKSGRWSVFPVKVDKDYSYIKDLACRALNMRLADKPGMDRKRPMEEEDPRRIALHLAAKEPEATSQLVKTQVSRFKAVHHD